MLYNDGTHRVAVAMNKVIAYQQVERSHPDTIEFIEASSYGAVGDDSKAIRYYTAEKIAKAVGYTGHDYSHAVTRIFEFFEDTEQIYL